MLDDDSNPPVFDAPDLDRLYANYLKDLRNGWH
jgi:hypothetical protein